MTPPLQYSGLPQAVLPEALRWAQGGWEGCLANLALHAHAYTCTHTYVLPMMYRQTDTHVRTHTQAKSLSSDTCLCAHTFWARPTPSSIPSAVHLASHPPSHSLPAQGGDRHLRGCQLPPWRPSPLSRCHPLPSVHRGLVGGARLPVHCALAPPCSAGPQSHWGPWARALHPENL